MPDRAIPPLLVGAAAGFIGGIIASVLQLTGGAAAGVAIAGAAVAFLAGVASTLGVEGPKSEKVAVGPLRGGLAIGVFLLVFFGLLALLRDGNPVLALLLLLAAGLYAGLLSRLRVRGRDELRRQGAQRAT